MGVLKAVFDFFVEQIFQTPAYFMALVVFIGCIFQKKDAKGTVVSVINCWNDDS